MKIMVMILIVAAVNSMTACSFKEKKVTKDKINIAFYVDDIKAYDPALVMYSDQYTLLENIYSRLVFIDNDSNLSLDLAKDYYWDNSSLVFVIREDSYTSHGRKITSEDVVKSYKRLMIRNTSSHFDLKDFLKVEHLNSVDDKIEQLYSDGNKVIFKLKKKNDLILRVLTSIDFAVIPTEAYDQKTLDIIDYSNTSGPYSVSKSTTGKNIILLRNKYKKEKFIEEVVLVHNREANGKRISVKMLSEGKVDFIPTVDVTTDEEAKKLSEVKSIDIFQTLPFELRYMVFTQKGLKRFSKEERKCIALLLKNKIFGKVHNVNIEEANQIFPKNSEGYLLDIEKTSDCNLAIDLKSLQVAALPGMIDANKIILKTLDLKFNVWNDFSFDNDYGENDLFFSNMDSAYYEDVSLIAMYGKMSLFGPEMSKRALIEYTSLDSKEDRLQYIKKLNKASVEEQYVIPIYFSPYRSFYNSNFEVPQSKLHLGLYFSKIRFRE